MSLVCKSTKWAYLADDEGEYVTNEHEIITIDNYVNNKQMQSDIKDKKIYIKCENNHILYGYISTIVSSHFTHNNNLYNSETKWHKDWKSKFELTEIQLRTDGVNDRIADAIVNQNSLEFQHSHRTRDEIKERTDDHKLHGYNINWIIDCNDDTIELINCNNAYLVKFVKDKWKYESFLDIQYIYMHKKDMVFRISPIDVKSDMICVNDYKTVDEFVKFLKSNEIWTSNKAIQCNVYIKQMGAGCGKTYDSVQLLNNITGLFSEKKTYIYLTKMKTATAVIRDELENQAINNKLGNTNLCSTIQESNSNNTSKQYKYNFIRSGHECNVVIGTIDSFMIRLGRKEHKENDYFSGIIKNILKKELAMPESNIIKYPTNIKLSKEVVIIIDEAQDLEPRYIEALFIIMLKTYIDVYVIGDKLQSIWGDLNIFTFLEKYEPNKNINKIVLSGENIVRRFHQNDFMNKVNTIIDFKKFGLVSIKGICDKSCKYIHDDDETPWQPFTLKTLTKEQQKKGENEQTILYQNIKVILQYMEVEINKHKYLPKNFMFIFSWLTKNPLAIALEPALTKFWIDKFKTPEYKEIINSDEYWSKNYHKKQYSQFVFFHKAQEGQSINLKESENATRLLSIHASKGSGCDVVFLLGLNEKTLHFYSNETGSLKYESLLHVAITRQKKKIYIGYEQKGTCNISSRIDPEHKTDHKNEPNPTIKLSIKGKNISTHMYHVHFNVLNKLFKITENISDNNLNKKLVDWGHHTIRYATLQTRFKINIYNREKNTTLKNQLKMIFIEISKPEIKPLEYKEYYVALHEIQKIQANRLNYRIGKENNNTSDPKKNITHIPVLYFKSHANSKFYEYKDHIIKIMRTVQNKLKKNNIPILCPLEAVILQHMMSIVQNHIFAETTIMDVYNIIYSYDYCGGVYIDDYHINNIYGCNCMKIFQQKETTQYYMDTQKSIVEHYKIINNIDTIYDKYRKCVDIFLGPMTYNSGQPVKYHPNLREGFKIYIVKDVIAYSKTHVVSFIIKPSISSLNFNELYVEMIMEYFILKNSTHPVISKDDDTPKYSNKYIIFCCISLDSNEPTFYDLNDIFTKKYKDIYEILLLSVKKNITDKCTILYDWCKFICNDSNDNDKLLLEKKYKKYFDDTPQDFITGIFKAVNMSSSGCGRNYFLKDKDSFMKVLDEKTYMFASSRMEYIADATIEQNQYTREITHNDKKYYIKNTQIYEDEQYTILIGDLMEKNILLFIDDTKKHIDILDTIHSDVVDTMQIEVIDTTQCEFTDIPQSEVIDTTQCIIIDIPQIDIIDIPRSEDTDTTQSNIIYTASSENDNKKQTISKNKITKRNIKKATVQKKKVAVKRKTKNL